MKERLNCASLAPEPVTHQHAIIAGGFLFSTVCGFDTQGKVVSGGIREQTRQLMENMVALLHVAGLTVDDLVKISVHIINKNDMAAMNEVYYKYFPVSTPMRCCTVVDGLFGELEVEMEIIAKTCV